MTWILLAALVGIAPAQESQPSQALADPAWAVASSRILGAAGTVRDRAWNLHKTAQTAAQQGRVNRLSSIAADAAELDRAVASAVLAAETLERDQPAVH